eukprot:SAG11_NODE_1847_length_4171_cov_4.518664_3_plen_70_part_00
MERQNTITSKIMTANTVPFVELHSRVIAKCGGAYTTKSDVCDDESKCHPDINRLPLHVRALHSRTFRKR